VKKNCAVCEVGDCVKVRNAKNIHTHKRVQLLRKRMNENEREEYDGEERRIQNSPTESVISE